ncbi:unnamed protein product [Polarella glacialis]|uniref:Uncharacterized protein n=1 Tax=Polarella glacialis TaxID=89957 RepID=A0A813F515_POLGL|nr:unnamed protein product [Polarella glacialis]CAE8689415.1 unnamed protein product [Polarella glacialis]
MVSLADSQWEMLWCLGLHRCLHWYELVRLAKSRKVFKDKFFTPEGLMRVLCLEHEEHNGTRAVMAKCLFKRLVREVSFSDVEEIIFRSDAPAQCLDKLVVESRLCCLSKLHTYDVQLLDIPPGIGRVHLPEIDSTDVLRILSQAPRLRVFIHNLTAGGRCRPFGLVHIDSRHKRAKLFDLVSTVLPSLQRFRVDFDFRPALSVMEKLAIRTKLPHHCAISSPFTIMFRLAHPNVWRMEWGTDESRLITTQLVPESFQRQWSTLTGSDLFNNQFDPRGWNRLASEQKAYFDSWAEKCKRYETRPVDAEDLCLCSEGPQWVVKKIGLNDQIGYLQPHILDDNEYIRWLPMGGQPGFTELVNWYQVGFRAAPALIRDLQLRSLLVPKA